MADDATVPSGFGRPAEGDNEGAGRGISTVGAYAGRGDGGLTTAERKELNRLRRENRQLKLEREILSKAAGWMDGGASPVV